jgi:hypothetical protein
VDHGQVDEAVALQDTDNPRVQGEAEISSNQICIFFAYWAIFYFGQFWGKY